MSLTSSPLSSQRASRPLRASLRPSQRALSLALAYLSVGSLGLISAASGAGLEFPESGSVATQRGGAAVSGLTDPTAGFLNPSVLSRLEGFQLTYNHNLIWSDVTFTRAPSQIPDPLNSDIGQGSSSNQTPFFGLNGLFALSYHLPNSPWSFGASVHGPNSGGASRFDVNGSQRYMMTSFEGLLGFAGASVAYGTQTWGVGLTPQLATMPSLRYRMVVDGASSAPLNPYESDLDVEAEVNVSDPATFTAIAGVWVRPTPSFEVALSGRLLPVRFQAEGDVRVNNTPTRAQYSEEQRSVEGSRAALELTLPRTARLGLRYRQPDEALSAGERFDVELALVYEGWSSVNAFNVDLEGTVNIFAVPLTDVVIEKRWRDTLSARLGGSYHVNDELTLSAGAFYEQGASPAEYAHVDFPSFDRVGVAGGAAFKVMEQLELMVGYLHLFESSSEVSELRAKVLQQRPIAPCPDRLGCGESASGELYTGVPANAGTISARFKSLTLGFKLAL